MDCPRCGGDLEVFVLQGSREVTCRRCGWVGTEATLAEVDAPESTGSWEDALARVSVRAGSVDRRSADLPAVATATAADPPGEPTPEVTRLPDAPAFEGWNDHSPDGDAGTDSDAAAERDPGDETEEDTDDDTGADADGDTEVDQADDTDEPDSDADGLKAISGDPAELEELRAAGIGTVEELAAADHLDLAERVSLSGDRVRTYVRRASIQVVTEESAPE